MFLKANYLPSDVSTLYQRYWRYLNNATIRLFADDCLLYKTISNQDHADRLQDDLDTYIFALPVMPQMFRCQGGGLSRAHSVGRPPCTPRQRVTTVCGIVLLVGCGISLGCYRFVPNCSCNFATQASAGLGPTQERLRC